MNHTDDHTRVIIPYPVLVEGNRIAYRAWYGTFNIMYRHETDQLLTIHDDDTEQTSKPIVYLNDQCRRRIVAIFALPENDDFPRVRPFLRVEVVYMYQTEHFDAQGVVFVIKEQEEPEL